MDPLIVLDRLPTKDEIRSMTDESFRLFAQAAIIYALPDSEKIVLVGGTDVALFSGIPRWSEDIDYKHSMSPKVLAGMVSLGLDKLPIGLRLERIPQGHVLGDKYNVRIHHRGTGRSAFIPFNQVCLPSLTASIAPVKIFGRPAYIMRESSAERIAEKMAACKNRILRPYLGNNLGDMHWRDLFDVQCLWTAAVHDMALKDLYRKKGGQVEDVAQLCRIIEGSRAKVENMVSREMENLLYRKDFLRNFVGSALSMPRRWLKLFEREKPERTGLALE